MCVVLSFVKRERKRENMLCVKHRVVGRGGQFARGLRGRFYRGPKLGLGTKGGVRTSGAWGKDVLVKVHGGGGKDVHWLVLRSLTGTSGR